MQEIEELKTAIELAGRVLNNLVVTPLEDGKYKILSVTAATERSVCCWTRARQSTSFCLAP